MRPPYSTGGEERSVNIPERHDDSGPDWWDIEHAGEMRADPLKAAILRALRTPAPTAEGAE